MSGLKVAGLAGTLVTDRTGQTIGEVIRVEADHRGRTRYVNVVLDSGAPVRIAAFNMWLSADGVRSQLDADLIARRAGQADPA